MKNPPKDARMEFPGFLELVTDIIYHLKKGLDGSGIDQHKHSRAAILSCALSVESSANCILSSLGLPKRSESEMERLPSISKLDVCIRMKTEGSKSIDRSNSVVAKVVELIDIRNDFVHPKRKALEAEWVIDPEPNEGFKIEMEYSDDTKSQLGIPSVGLHWDSSHAKVAAEATFRFFDHLFTDLLQLDSGDVYHLVGNRMVATISNGGELIASGPVQEYEELIEWADDYGLSIRFLRST